jgi:hypothetical protein
MSLSLGEGFRVRVNSGFQARQGLYKGLARIIAVSGRVRDTSTQEAIEINRLE